jgi:tight adherence protein B
VKRFLIMAAAALAAAALSSTAGATAAPRCPCLTVAKGPAFPVRTYVLTLKNPVKLTVNDLRVTENGNPVVQPTLVPASKTGKKTFGVVLVLDTSYSMKGKPIAAAVAAEQAFVAQRNPNEQVGLIEFNREPTPKLNLTTSASQISNALAPPLPSVGPGTHIFDAVAKAEQMLANAHINSGSIVVLSDGADTGSTHTLEGVAKAAVHAHMRIYTIGLQDQKYKPGTLRALADAGNGVFAQANAQKLATLFDQLGRQLSSEYVLQYKSPSSLGTKHVQLQVRISGVGTTSTSYPAPALPVSAPPPPYKPSIGSRIWGSWITTIVIALLGAGAIAFLLIALVEPKRSGPPARMAEFVSIRGLQRDRGELPSAEGEDAEEQEDFWTRFEHTLEIADIKTPPEMIVAGTFALTTLTFLLIWVGTGSPWWALFALAIPYFAREWVIRTLAHRRNRFAEQLPDALQVVASALRSGHSFAGALAVVVESASEPMKSEMQRVVADEQLGVPIQQSLAVVAERMASRDVEQLALVAELQREAGGNAAEVVDRVAETVRERFDLKRLIQTLTMQGRMSRWIVSALPIGIVLVLQVDNPHYLHPLLASTAGKVVFGFAAAWAVAGSFVIKKIVEIEV